MDAKELYNRVISRHTLIYPRPKAPQVSQQQWAKVSITLGLGIFPALFAALATFFEFSTTRQIAGMTESTAQFSALVGIIAFEFLLLALPFLKAWVEDKRYVISLSIATFLGWLVSTVANLNMTGAILGSQQVDISNVLLYDSRLAFIFVTGVSGATIAVLLGEAAGGMIKKVRTENAIEEEGYERRLKEWQQQAEATWLSSAEYKALKRHDRRLLTESGNGAPKVDWRTLSDDDKMWIAKQTDIELVMREYGMVPDQRKTAQAWMAKAVEEYG